MRFILLFLGGLLLSSCKQETINLYYSNTEVSDKQSRKIPAVLIGLNEMQADQVMKLEDVLHELVDDTSVKATIAGLIKSIDHKKGLVTVWSKTGSTYEFKTKNGFPLRGQWDNQMALFDSEVIKTETKQGFELVFTSMLVLNQQIDE